MALQRKPLRHRSAKTEAKYVLRRALVERFIGNPEKGIAGEREKCEACPLFAVKDGKRLFVQRHSKDVHEILRRSQTGSILDESNLLAVCRSCHDRIGMNRDDEAYILGLSVPGWADNKPEMIEETVRLRANWSSGISDRPSWLPLDNRDDIV